jgi:hypothetical protein
MRAVRQAETLPLSCAVVMKSENFNFLEPSGPLQTCNGTALRLPLCRRPLGFLPIFKTVNVRKLQIHTMQELPYTVPCKNYPTLFIPQ